MNLLKSVALASVVSSALLAGSAHASPIDYVFSGSFDGYYNDSQVSGETFTVSLTGDTANVFSSGGELFNDNLTAVYTLGNDGLVTGSFLGLSNVVLNPGFNTGTIVFGEQVTTDAGYVAEGLSAPTLGAYDLASNLGLTSGTISQTPGSTYQTIGGGTIAFNDILSLSVRATVSPDAAATPLPASLPMFLAAVGLMGVVMWKRKATDAIG